MDDDFICIEEQLGQEDLEYQSIRRLHLAPKAPGSWKQATLLRVEIERFIKVHGIDNVALHTLLFEHPRGRTRITPAQAQRIFKKAARTLLPRFFPSWIAVLDYHRDGAIHFHLVVSTKVNIRKGWNWDIDEQHRELQQRVRNEKRRMTNEEKKESRRLCKLITSNPAVKAIWKRLRKELAQLGFAQVYPFELKPIRNPAGLAVYLAGRYQESRARLDLRPHHSRCVRFSNVARCCDQKLRFSPVGEGAATYRRKKAVVGAAMGITDIEGMVARFGASWEHDFRDILFPINRCEHNGFFTWQQTALRERSALFVPPTSTRTVVDDLKEAVARRAGRDPELPQWPAPLNPLSLLNHSFEKKKEGKGEGASPNPSPTIEPPWDVAESDGGGAKGATQSDYQRHIGGEALPSPRSTQPRNTSPIASLRMPLWPIATPDIFNDTTVDPAPVSMVITNKPTQFHFL